MRPDEVMRVEALLMGLVPVFHTHTHIHTHTHTREREREREREMIPLSTTCRHNEKTVICKHGRGLSPDTRFSRALIMDFSVSRTVRNQIMLGKPPRL